MKKFLSNIRLSKFLKYKSFLMFSKNKIIFLSIGGITFLVYLIALWIVRNTSIVPYPIAVGSAYFCAITVHFFANRRYTFSAHEVKVSQQLIPYVIMAIINYLFQIFIIYLLFDLFQFNFYLSVFWATSSTILIGYLLMKNWVFVARK